MSEADPSRPETALVFDELQRGVADWADPRVPALLSWLRAGQRRSELRALLQSDPGSLASLTPGHARSLIELLCDFELVKQAYAVSTLAQFASDPEIAAQCARVAMQLRDYHAAIAASELAIAGLLQPGLAIDEFLRLCLAGAPAEGMLRFERHVLADRVHLSERLGLRWEALHRAGRARDASLMQLMCQRYFPERASVWATAGNHALDGDDLEAAAGYFRRCLKLDASWTAALAGMAIVCERQKQWDQALPYRQRVVEIEQALTRDDAASLQRRLRYAAALARMGRWTEAEPLYRSAASAPALRQLPAEHPVILRVFSQELYAPALVSALLNTGAGSKRATTPDAATVQADVARAQNDDAPATRAAAAHDGATVQADVDRGAGGDVPARGRAAGGSVLAQAQGVAALRVELQEPALRLALHEAGLLERIRVQLSTAELGAAEMRWGLALCAYLAGDLERAYGLFDQAELDRPDDLALHYLLWRCACAVAHPQTASIREFAERAARAYWEHARPASELQLQFAVMILPELAEQAASQGLAGSEQDELEPSDVPLLAQLERVVAFRAAHHAAGRSPLVAAAASSQALAASNASVL